MAVLLVAQSGTSGLTGLVGWIADVIVALGPVGVGLLIVIETVFPPIPSEAVLPMGGYLASRGRMSYLGVVAGSTAGSLVGAYILYALGARLGRRRVDALLRALPLMEQEDVDRARAWFDDHGGAAVFFGRFIPGVRSLISIPAGTEGMSVGWFSLLTLAGSAIWNVALVTAGWFLGEQWRTVAAYSDYLNYALYAAIGVAVAHFVWKRRDRIGARRHRQQTP